jgi:uncharacterized membrane protein required for colicin V production
MTFYDWAVVGIAAVFVVRGWRRGALREAIDVAILLVGSLIAFRVTPTLGSVISGMANVPYEVGRIVAGVAVFLALVVGSILLGRVIPAARRVVPGASTLDRFVGAAAGLAFAAIVVVVGTTIAAAAPMPRSARAAVDERVRASAVGRVVVDPAGPLQPAVAAVSGERLFGTVIAVREAVGERLMAGTIPVPFPAVEPDDLVPSPASAESVFAALNRERISIGADPLAWSPDLADVATRRAAEVYGSGVLGLDDGLRGDLREAGVPGTLHGEMVVMAASPDGLLEAVLAAPAYEDMATGAVFHRSGIGVVEGPYGFIAVQVLSG